MVEQMIQLSRLLAGLFCFIALNLISGTGKANLENSFDKTVFIAGIKKALFIFICIILLCGAGLCLPEFEFAVGAEGAPLTIFAALKAALVAANAKYGFDAITNLTNIFGVKASVVGKEQSIEASIPEETEFNSIEEEINPEEGVG